MDGRTDLSLICRVRTRLCALPLGHVVEVMRPLPVEPVAGVPPFIRGLTLIRGRPLPVVDAACLLGLPEAPAGRYVTLAVGGHHVALAVDDVLGIQSVAAGELHALPPLLHGAVAEFVEAIGTLDSELLLVLRGASLLSEDEWARLDSTEAGA